MSHPGHEARTGAWAAGTVVVGDRVLAPGTVVAGADGLIAAVEPGVRRGARDLGASTILVPGAVDLHGDAIEGLCEPRPGVRMPLEVAARALDARLASSGVTTGFAAVSFAGRELGLRDPATAAALLATLRELPDPRVEHRAHARVEVTDPESVAAAERMVRAGEVDLASVMDHTPGQGQFQSVAAYARYQEGHYGRSRVEIEELLGTKLGGAERVSELAQRVAAAASAAGIPLAWHDPDSPAVVATAAAMGAVIAEFPTTAVAARAAREAGMAVAGGAPNLLRGVSSSGNLSAREALRAGVLDVAVSDYYPEAMWPAALATGLPLPAAVALVSAAPARAAGLDDRGRLAEGLRADLVGLDGLGRVRCVVRGGVPVG